MCSFLLTTLPISYSDLKSINYRLVLRGPDFTNIQTYDAVSYLHNLLNITGPPTLQPFVSYSSITVYNGEIYNSSFFGDFESDGLAIPNAYDRYGHQFLQYLDGEYALCIYDRKNRHFLLATDTFGTKPLFFAIENNNLAISSFYTSIASLGFKKISRVSANTCVIINRDSFRVSVKNPVFTFNVNQHKCHYDDWIAAFETSVRKRATNINKKLFVPLSSGYDSGAMVCELLNQSVDFKTFSYFANEDSNVLASRLSSIPGSHDADVVKLSSRDYSLLKKYLSDYADSYESFIYSPLTGYFEYYSFLEDPASIALAYICKLAQSQGFRICLSGQGADEIMSDYSLYTQPIYDHSNFSGVFPDDLRTIFPWPSFYGSTQSSYLLKEEYVAGAFGIETRYPFLDRQLVQEFLNLEPDLKNLAYKAPLAYFLQIHNYPFAANIKNGFHPI